MFGHRDDGTAASSGDYASNRLDTSPVYLTTSTPFIPAAAWLGSVQR